MQINAWLIVCILAILFMFVGLWFFHIIWSERYLFERSKGALNFIDALHLLHFSSVKSKIFVGIILLEKLEFKTRMWFLSKHAAGWIVCCLWLWRRKGIRGAGVVILLTLCYTCVNNNNNASLDTFVQNQFKEYALGGKNRFLSVVFDQL